MSPGNSLLVRKPQDYIKDKKRMNNRQKEKLEDLGQKACPLVRTDSECSFSLRGTGR